MIRLPHEFLEFLKLLNETNCKYLLIGGYAVAYYGFVRATGDLDVFVECSEENAEKLKSACSQFGLGDSVTKETFLEPGRILRFGVPPMRLEILNEISGVTFEECWETKESIDIDDCSVHAISLPCLLKNKKSSGRTKDQMDVEELEG